MSRHHRDRHAAAVLPAAPVRHGLLPALPRAGPVGPAGVGGAVVRVPGGGGGPDLAGARLPDARPGGDAVRREPGDPALPRGVDRPHQGARPRPAGQLRPGPGGLPLRAAGDADAAHLHPARGRRAGLQPTLPDVLLGVLPGPGRRGSRRPRHGQRRCPAGPGERPAGTSSWSPVASPRSIQTSPRSSASSRTVPSTGSCSTPTASGSRGTTLWWSGWPLTGTGSRCTCSTTGGEPRPTARTAVVTCCGAKRPLSTGCPRRRSSARSP